MGDIQWVMRSIFIVLSNDLIMWIFALVLSVLVINIILEVFNENYK